VRVMTSRLLLALLLGVCLTSTAAAQRRRMRRPGAAPGAYNGPRIGPHIGYNTDASEAFIGAQASLPVSRDWDFYPSLDIYLVSGGSLWGLSGDVKYRPPTALRALYVGGGINYLHASAGGVSGSNTNVDILGGWEWRRIPLLPYVEAKLIFGNGSSFQFGGGINFRLKG